MNRYYLLARLSPAILTSIPICTAYYSFVAPFIANKAGEIHWISTTGNITLTTALVFLFIQVNRIVSKEVFQKAYFKDELEMPTTEYLLHRNSYFTGETKKQIREKIQSEYGTELYDLNRENSDEIGARKQIIMSVSQVRGLLNGTKNDMVLRHNIEYGFMRNLIGGSLVALFVCIVMMFLFKFYETDQSMFYISIAIAVPYFILVLFSKKIINYYGHYYAKILFEQYLLTKK